jgi:hypothetical protein
MMIREAIIKIKIINHECEIEEYKERKKMIEVLKWMHESFWHYVSVCFMLFWCFFWCAVIASLLSKIGRPRKHVKYSYKDTHNL